MLQSLEPTALASPGTTSRHTGGDTCFAGSSVSSQPISRTLPAVDTAHLPGSFGLPAWEKSLMTSILSAGTFFGALVTGDVADVSAAARLSSLAVSFLPSVAFLSSPPPCHRRLVADVGVGFISAIIILHMSEIAPKKISTQACGALVSGYQFAITIGHSKRLDTAMAGTGSWEALGPVLHSFDWESRGSVEWQDRLNEYAACERVCRGGCGWERRSAIRDPGPAGGCRDGGSGLARQVSRAVGLGLGAVPGKPLNTGSFDMVIQDLACFMISNWHSNTGKYGEYVDQAEIRGNT
ncbi:hypothetical protein B0H14DRAFT_3598974 [Mycena olivaceomarginata]|nr:hypothetical protein B0H14DRAFT_3598974 [Mycena olivaceomarginata]